MFNSNSFGFSGGGSGGGGGGTVTGADSGVSLVGRYVTLGNQPSAEGDPGQLLARQVVELSDFDLTFKHGTDGLIMRMFGGTSNKIITSDDGTVDDPHGTVFHYYHISNHARAILIEGASPVDGLFLPLTASNTTPSGTIQYELYNDVGQVCYLALTGTTNVQNPSTAFFYSSTVNGIAFYAQGGDPDTGGIFFAAGNTKDDSTIRILEGGKVYIGPGAGNPGDSITQDYIVALGDVGNTSIVGVYADASDIGLVFMHSSNFAFRLVHNDPEGMSLGLSGTNQESCLNMSVANGFVVNEPGWTGSPYADTSQAWARINSQLQARMGVVSYSSGGSMGETLIGNTVYCNTDDTPSLSNWTISGGQPIGSSGTYVSRSATQSTSVELTSGSEFIYYQGSVATILTTNQPDATITIVKVTETDWVVVSSYGTWT